MMRTISSCYLTTAALLWICFSTRPQAIALPLDSGAITSAAASTGLPNIEDSLPSTQQEPAAGPRVIDPIETLLAKSRHTVEQGTGVFDASQAVPPTYPGGSRGTSEWSPTHFEIEGFAQWRNISSDGSLTTTNYGNASFSGLSLANYKAGPLVRFIWTPEFKILGATSKVWIEYGQIPRSRTRTIMRTVSFPGVIYIINTTLRAELKTKQFELGYAPRWGNDKFRIGPSFTYERLSVGLTLTDLSPNASPPITRSFKVPNNVFLIGADFDYTPVRRFDIYGKAGAVPCCGSGWHVFESELGTKVYFIRSLSLMGGVRYAYLKRDFNVPAFLVNGVSVGPYSGFLKTPGVGPFVGASYRF
jgi:hypothetical protein